MKSLVLQFNESGEASEAIATIKSKGTGLELAPMCCGETGAVNKNFDQLLIAGDERELHDTLEMLLGREWKSYIIQGEMGDREDRINA